MEEQKRRPIKMKMKIIIIIYNSTFDSDSALSLSLPLFSSLFLVSVLHVDKYTSKHKNVFTHTLFAWIYSRSLVVAAFPLSSSCSMLAAAELFLLSIFSNQCRHWLFRLCIPIFFPFSSPCSPRCLGIAVVAIIIIKYRSRAMCFDLMMVLWLYQVHKIELRQRKERPERNGTNKKKERKKEENIKNGNQVNQREIYMCAQNHYLIDWNWSERLM